MAKANKKQDNRKGFLFVVTVFLILTYILLSISVWVKSIEASESTYSEFYKESNVELAVEQITSEKLDSISSIVLNRALFVLSNQSISHPLKDGGASDPYSHITAAFGEWLQNGSPGASHFEGGAAPSEYNSSMAAWAENLNASMAATGVYMEYFKVYGFTMTQTDIDIINYTFSADLRIRVKSGATFVGRTYHISNYLNITGMLDPAIARNSSGANQILGRRFYFLKSNYSQPSDLHPREIYAKGAAEAGQGWFYGYLVDTSSAGSVSVANMTNYILVGDYSSIVGTPNYELFGAYIVTSPIGHPNNCTKGTDVYWNEENTFNPVKYGGSNCDPAPASLSKGVRTPKPFIVAPNFHVSDGRDCPDFVNTSLTHKCALFVTAANVSSDDIARKLTRAPLAVYDVEALRDFTLCGYYIKDPLAPSFLQRLLGDSYSRHDASYGIETFLIGQYVDSSLGDSYSRLDREMFSKTPGIFIRGAPGCKDVGSCSYAGSPFGRFGLGSGAISAFNLGAISCDNPQLAGCG